ncbi:CAP domain-containing protein [Nocardia sp. NBC_00565]|uniref:CAP domain-containing protein n=1 Tax=Nocardia sp. NBC_00565 TaxID=2975993 RepID=UPI002E81842F|nr:CAP domain-containing protein [Nocardia sp. NBC_00565]WUC04935.1 CAP domain-containing protein [Nocardia sp. NBC_00565]
MKFKTTAAALAVFAGAGLFALPAAAAAPLTNCDVDSAALALRGEESVVFDQINKMRAEAGLKPVTHTDVLARPAEWASNDSAERGSSPADHVDTLGRDIKTRFAQCGVPTNAPKIAEINFYGTNVEPADAMRFWSNSPGHRAIILDSQLDNIGVAVIYQGDRRHWTVTFANSGATAQPVTVTRENLTGAQHQTEFDNLVAQGYRITDIRVTGGNDPRYSSTWFRNDGRAWQARHGLDSGAYQAEFDKLLGQGYRLTLVRGYEVNGSSRFVGIWEKNDGRAWQARHDISVDTFNTTAAQLSAQGYKLVHEHRYTVKGQTYVAAIWNK